MTKVIYSLCDYSGNWCKPYREAGYEVHQIDLKLGSDVRWLRFSEKPVYGVLAAPDCNCFSVSGAQYWPAKDADGRTLAGLELINACRGFILSVNPVFWCIENPVGRTKEWLGKPVMYFDPCDYGDAYTKKTCLWGKFNVPIKTPVEPVKVCSQGSWVQKLGGKSEKTKELRSITPPGFAKAFFEANQ